MLYRAAIQIGRLCQRAFIGKGGMIEKMGGMASGWTDGRNLTPIARRTFHQFWQESGRIARPAGETDTAEKK
jgi:hypothetical protein